MTKAELLTMYLDTSVEPILIEEDGRTYYRNTLISKTGEDLEIISWMKAEDNYPMVYRWKMGSTGNIKGYKFNGNILEYLGEI